MSFLDFWCFFHVDFGQDMASKGPEEHLRTSDTEKSVSNLRSDTLAPEGGSESSDNVKFSSASEARQKGESRADVVDPQCNEYGLGESSGDKKDFVPLPERGAPKDGEARNDVNLSLHDSGIRTAETSKGLSVSGKEMDAAISIKEESCNEAYVLSLETGTKKMVAEDTNQEPTRCGDAHQHALDLTNRTLSVRFFFSSYFFRI